MQPVAPLRSGDTVAIVLPASSCPKAELDALSAMLGGWGLTVSMPDDLFGKDLFCANTDEKRFQHLQAALDDPAIKAIIVGRGGYGSQRLIPFLAKMPVPKTPKIFVGMSDTTALQLYMQKHWQWATIHGALAPSRFSEASIAALKALLFGEVQAVQFANLLPRNQLALDPESIRAPIIGGNLSLIQAGMGTSFEIQSKDQMLFLEEINERGYRIDRMLQQLVQAGVLDGLKAIILGDFLGGDEPDGSSLIAKTLDRFAAQIHLPVFSVTGVGHGYTNFPLPLGSSAVLTAAQLTVKNPLYMHRLSTDHKCVKIAHS